MVHRTSDPAFGVHLAQKVGLRDLGLVGYIIFHSQTLSCGLKRLSRYSRIVADDMGCSLIPEGSRIRLEIATDPLLVALRHPVDTRLVFFANAVREATGVQLDPVEVRFPYRQRMELAAHRDAFRAPLVFGRRTAALVYRAEDLQRPTMFVDETLQNYLEQLADQVMASLDAHPLFANRVRGVIFAQLSDGNPSRRQVAETLGVSVRTLQRRLSEERTSFASLLDDLRRQMSLQLLRDSSLAVYEIAFLLGYADPSTFYQAFRRWTGSSPRRYRISGK
jgi:AraC-like DNA-binding protein